MVLEITEWIKMPNVEKNELRIHVFSKSLCGDAKTSKILDDLDNDAQDANDVYEVINREYSPIPIPSRRDIDNPDELCRTEEFTVVRHSIDNDEEFVIVGPSKVSTVERTPSRTIRRILGFRIRRIDPYTADLDETMIWYNLKKTCVELIQAF
ncbi:hypothetical protein Tco_0668490 [Tanacetum coccineum]